MKNIISNLFFLIILLSCQSQSSNKNNDNAMKIEKVALTDSSLAIPQNIFWEAKYEIGNPNFRGKTRVVIKSADKKAIVTFTRGEETLSYEQGYAQTEMNQFFESLNKDFPTDYKAKNTTPKPDEDKVIIVFVINNKVNQLEFWHNEKWSNEKLKSLCDLFTKIAQNVSKGKIKY